ncbi:MAG TPA: DUF58 domain-containing protein, partial [Planctomycetaceae bacterium]|nr:DUF58 domain-containing protein [Planctomycetaceae bacterium]
MKFRPGPVLIGLAISAVVFAGAAFFAPVAAKAIPLLCVVALVLALYDWWWLGRHRGDLSITQVVPQLAGRDAAFEVALRVKNSGASQFRGVLRTAVPNAAEPRVWITDFQRTGIKEFEDFRQQFRIATRGQFEFGPVSVGLSGPCRVLDAIWDVAGRNRVKVYPEGLVAEDDLSQELAAEIQILDRRSRSKRRSVGTEFESISEFRLGDDPRRIDWRATARTRRLVVRRFQVEQHQDVFVLIDCGRLMGSAAGRGTKLDCAVDSALYLARTALANGDRFGLALFDSDVTAFLPPRSGLGALPTIVECVYDAQSRWQETDFSPLFAQLQARHHKRAVLIILSDVADQETSKRARVVLANLAARHAVIFAALQTPLLTAQTRAPIHSRLDAARQVVAYRLLRERE